MLSGKNVQKKLNKFAFSGFWRVLYYFFIGFHLLNLDYYLVHM